MSVPQTLYITGISRPATENPISQRHRVLFLAFLVDAKTGTILEVEVNALWWATAFPHRSKRCSTRSRPAIGATPANRS